MNHATKGTVWQLLWRFTLCSVASPSEEMVLTLRHVKQSQLSSAVASSSIPGCVFETATTRRTSFLNGPFQCRSIVLICINICPEIRHSGGCFDAKLFPPTWILKVKYDWNCHVQAVFRCTTKVWLYAFAWFCMQTIRNHASMSAPFNTEPLSSTTTTRTTTLQSSIQVHVPKPPKVENTLHKASSETVYIVTMPLYI